MAEKTGFLPPSDLLQRLEGIEAGLRKNKKVGRAGWLGLVPSLTGLVVALLEGDRVGREVDQSVLVSTFGVLSATFLFLVGRSRLWRTESRQPFRYTCTVRRFQPLAGLASNQFKELSEWMEYDLAERLNERIGRLSFFDAPHSDGDAHSDPAAALDDDASHVDVTGQYLVRERHHRNRSGEHLVREQRQCGEDHYKRMIEVTPRVRIGGGQSPATLGHPVKFTIRVPPGSEAETVDTGPSLDRTGAGRTAPGQMELDDYDKLIERVYFSVATEIYRQIRKDVQRKIQMLPTPFLRATAYFYEAEDYARSNTLDAYDEARQLYESATQMYDPRLRPPPRRKVFRPLLWLLQVKTKVTWFLRRVLANFVPRLSLPEVMAAKSEIGYANTLLHRRLLAGMSGHKINPTYEARPVVNRAIKRLDRLPRDVPGCQEALFQAHVTAALSWWSLEAISKARGSLRAARRVFPSAFSTDARYLFAAGLIDPRLHSSVPVLTHAVEQEPRFEIAQFELAVRSEMMWRRASTLEKAAATKVFEEYETVLKLDPGNIRAWGNLGYMRWLLGEGDEARLAFERGREYKQIQRGTDIGSLDYGLARVAAEEGNLDEAYAYYQSAVAAQITQVVSDAKNLSSQFYFFDYIGDAMLERFERFCDVVVRRCDEEAAALSAETGNGTHGAAKEERPAAPHITPKMFDSVAAFVFNDYGEACHTYYIRNGDRNAETTARACYEKAMRRDPKFVMPYYNLFLINRYERDIDAAVECLDKVEDLEPSWPHAILARLSIGAEWASDQTWRKPVDRSDRPRARRRPELAFEVPGEVKQKAGLENLGDDVKEKLEALIPHDWLWRSNGDGLEFDWRAVYRAGLERTLRWEREMDDLHVRSLFMWDIANLLNQERGPLAARALGRARIGHWGEDYDYVSSAPVMLLRQIKEHFWPSDLRVLLTWRQLYPDREADDGIRELIRHWLGQDPTSWWALELLVTDVLDFRGDEIIFFTSDEKRKHLHKALEQLDLAPGSGRAERCMRDWIETQLVSLS